MMFELSEEQVVHLGIHRANRFNLIIAVLKTHLHTYLPTSLPTYLDRSVREEASNGLIKYFHIYVKPEKDFCFKQLNDDLLNMVATNALRFIWPELNLSFVEMPQHTNHGYWFSTLKFQLLKFKLSRLWKVLLNNKNFGYHGLFFVLSKQLMEKN